MNCKICEIELPPGHNYDLCVPCSGYFKLKIGPYTISIYGEIPRAGKNNIWIEHEGGEGMSLDLDEVYKNF